MENCLHWVVDGSFDEDAGTIRKDNAPPNLSLLTKIALNLIRQDTTNTAKTSLRLKHKSAAWDDDVRMNIGGSQYDDTRVRKPCSRHRLPSLLQCEASARPASQ